MAQISRNMEQLVTEQTTFEDATSPKNKEESKDEECAEQHKPDDSYTR